MLRNFLASLFRELAITYRKKRSPIQIVDKFYGVGKTFIKKNGFKPAINLDEKRANEHYNNGVIYQQQGILTQALACYREAISINPDHTCALHSAGVLSQKNGELDTALQYFLRLAEITPDVPNLDARIAAIYSQKNAFEKALFYFQKALSQNECDHHINAAIGAIYCNLGDLVNAKAYYQRSLDKNGSNPEVHNNIGYIFLSLGETEKAIFHLEIAIQLRKNFHQAYNNLGVAYRENCKLAKAEHELLTALALAPNSAEAASNLGSVYLDKGQVTKADKYFRLALNLKPTDIWAHSNLLLSLNYDKRYDPVTIFRLHKAWSNRHIDNTKSIKLSSLRHTSVARLKVGYVSPDFRSHSVAYFIEPVLANHNKKKIETYCYYNSACNDETTERLQKNVSSWRNIYGKSDEIVAKQITQDGIDILIDLAGHTNGHRLTLMALKPAPVQIAYLGYPNTTGISAMDYRLTDIIADPPESEKFYVEKLIRLPRCFLCYQPPLISPVIPCQSTHGTSPIVFASFNHGAKICKDVTSAWCEILSRVAGSKIVLKNRSLSDPTAREHIHQLFQNHGIDADRIVLLDWKKDVHTHLTAYCHVDIALDTFPYNGTTTTFEALWMGVPVITLSGNTHAGRVGHSILTSLNQNQLVALSVKEYIEIAVSLANDVLQRTYYKNSLRSILSTSKLMDGKDMATSIENAYEYAWNSQFDMSSRLS